jgi:hypothetical protein
MRKNVRSRGPSDRQRGFGGLFLLFFVGGLAASAGLFAFYRIDTVAAKNVRETSDVVAATKAALIGYAVQRGRTVCTDPVSTNPAAVAECARQLTERPGELPCPDTNNDGVGEATCIAGAVGRVPWKSLGIPEPRDRAGEILWYAISGNFRNRASWPTSPHNTLNSDTRGTITVRAANNATALVTDAAAVIFAPGASQSAQNRSNVDASCTVLHASNLFERSECPSNYLETATFDAVTRAVTRVFVPNTVTDAVNDRVAYITTAEIITPVELRVAGEIKKLLEEYRANSPCQCYPWAEDWPYMGGIADLGQNRGRLPSQASPHDWGTNGVPAMPQWLDSNDWHNLVWYSVGRKNSDTAGRICRTCSSRDMLRVVTQQSPLVTTDVSVVFFLPGTAGATPRLPRPPSGSLSTSQRNITDDALRYLEDAQNYGPADEANCPVVGDPGGTMCTSPSTCYSFIPGQTSCDTYIVPQSRARDRDRLYTLTSAPPTACRAPARVLVDNGPCKLTGNTVNTICLNAVTEISTSGCSAACVAAANAMITTPCRNNYSASGCPAHITALNSCSS